MTYYSLRLTLPKIFPDLDYPALNQRARDISYCSVFLKKLISKKIASESSYSCGYEVINKFGEPADPHIHFNFISECHKESLRRWITRTFRDIYQNDYSLKGNSMYKLDSYSEPEDFDLWIMYPLKENPVRRFCYFPIHQSQNCPKNESIMHYHSIASKLMLVRHQKNREYRDKAAEKKTFYDKLKIHLNKKRDDKEDTLSTDPTAQQIWFWTLDYYRAQKKSLNFVTIDGYVRLYMWEIELVTKQDLWQFSSLA